MDVCKSKQIQNFCHPNAIMTLKEYLEDYASPETKVVGDELIKRELETLESENVKNLTKENVEKIAKGERDFRF